MAKKQEDKKLEGIITTTRNGLGFFPLDGKPRAVRIAYEDLNTALNGDRVFVSVRKKGDEYFGRVESVVERAKKQYVGVLEKEHGHSYIVPDDSRMYVDILIKDTKEARPGDKVLVKMGEWKSSKESPTGTILEVIGARGEHEVEIQSIVLDKGIDIRFPKDVQKEAEEVHSAWHKNGAVDFEKEIISGDRKDFRALRTFTIDPADAKDFDDALSVEEKDGGDIEIGVHIADASHFVRPGNALDTEARERGFSVYLVDRTIPMLPPELSNDICSLNPETDRLTFSAIFRLDKDANVKTKWFGKGVIHSDKRFSYEDAQEILNAGKGSHVDDLKVLDTLSKKLRDARFKEGSIDFDQDEVKVEIDERGMATRIYRKERLDTHKLIEEFMLLANKHVALSIFEAHGKKAIEKAFLYRIHDLPNREKIEHIAELVHALGFEFDIHGKDVSPSEINKLFKQIEGKPIEGLVKTAMVRSMAKAVYDTKNIGHFGLGFGFYTHFTSPIRRYSDLVVHRLLIEHLKGREVSEREFGEYKMLGQSLSNKEVTIQEAERESIKYKQVEFMQQHIGSAFDGVVTGVTEWGIYVEEVKTGAEGMVRTRDLRDDYYVLNERAYKLVGKRTRKEYALGDKVKFKVKAADVDKKMLDFELI